MQAQCLYDTQIMIGPTCPPFGDPSPTGAHSISDNSIVAGGFAQCYPDDEYGVVFTWTLESGMSVIPLPDWVITMGASDINASGQLAMNMDIECTGCGTLAFLFERGAFTPLPLWPGANYSVATSLNSTGSVVGWSGNNLVGDPAVHAVLWQDGRVIDIGAHLPVNKSTAWDINESNVVVGRMDLPTFLFDGFIYDQGRVQLLGPIPGGVSSGALAINNFNVVVGAGQVPGPTPSGLVGHAFQWTNGKMIDLGVLPGEIASIASDVNDIGIIVGSSGDGFGHNKACIWYGDDGPIDLNMLIASDPNLVIEGATAINQSGQITAVGQLLYEGFWTQVGILLTPKPANPADLTGDCRVDGSDLTVLLQSWGLVKGSKRNANPAADLDDNGVVNGFDLAMLLGAWS